MIFMTSPFFRLDLGLMGKSVIGYVGEFEEERANKGFVLSVSFSFVLPLYLSPPVTFCSFDSVVQAC